MKHVLQLATICALVLVATMSEARSLRATELSSLHWESLSAADLKDLVIEFREGDAIPVHLSASGDFFEMSGDASPDLHIKKNFFVKFTDGMPMVSLDGISYRSLKDVMSGTLSVGADQAGGVADALNVVVSAVVKK